MGVKRDKMLEKWKNMRRFEELTIELLSIPNFKQRMPHLKYWLPATFAPGVARDLYYVRKNQSDSRNAIRYRIPDLYLDYIALGGARNFYGLRTNNVSKYFDRLIFGCKRKQFLF